MEKERLKLLLCGPGISGDRDLINALQPHYSLHLANDIHQLERTVEKNSVALILIELTKSRKAELRAIKKVKSIHQEVVVLVINDHKNINNVIEVFDAGAADVFSKPWKAGLIADRAEALLKTTVQNKYVSNNIKRRNNSNS